MLSASLTWGIALAVAGLILAALVWGFLKALAMVPTSTTAVTAAVPPVLAEEDDAILIVERGGRLQYLNATAREWFSLPEVDPPDLERVLSHVSPSDEFLSVCTVPAQKRLSLDGRPVDVSSYWIPGARPQLLVSVRMRQVLPSPTGDAGDAVASSLSLITDFVGSVSTNLDLDSLLGSVADNILRLVSAEFLEVGIREAGSHSLVVYQLEQPPGSRPRMVRSDQGQFGALQSALVESRKPVFLPDATLASGVEGGVTLAPVVSYWGTPLVVDQELVGILQAGRVTGPPFTQAEFDLVQLLAVPSAAAIQNVIRLEQERRRVIELSALARIANAASGVRDLPDLIGRLVQSIAPAFDAQVLGFLLYDERERVLVGQPPFHGLPAKVVEAYRCHIVPGSPADDLVNLRAPIVTADATTDERWSLLGLTDVAVAASLRDSVLIPLLASDRLLGFVQLSNSRGRAAGLADSELRMLEAVASQAAAAIQSAQMTHISVDHADRSETLRRIAAALAAATTAQEALTRSLHELATLLEADLCAALLLDEVRGRLELHAASTVGLTPGQLERAPSLAVDEPAYFRTVTGSRQALLSGRLSLDGQLPTFYGRLFTGIGLESALIVPLVAHGNSLGELIVASRGDNRFNESDAALMDAAAANMAATLENFRLASQTDHSLRRRSDQNAALARASREMAGSLSVQHLLSVIHAEAIRLTGADCGSVLLAKGAHAAPLPSMQSTGCRSGEELSQVERRTMEGGTLLSVVDFSSEALPPPHAGVRSALLVPIVDAGHAIGLLQLHAARPVAFDAAAHDSAEALASQAAVALRNALQVQEERWQAEVLRRRGESWSRFSLTSQSLLPEQPLERALASIAEGIREATPFRTVVVSVHEPETGVLRTTAGAGIEQQAFAELQARKRPVSTVQQLLKPEFRIGRSYFLPADRTPEPLPDVHPVNTIQYSVAEARHGAWRTGDLMLCPLEDGRGNLLGLISLDDPGDGLRPDRLTIESVELFGAQAARVIDSARRMRELSSRVESLSAALDRQQLLLGVTQNPLPIFLRKDLEQTIAVHNLERRASRIRSGLAIIESVSRQPDTSSALQALARETLTHFRMTMALIGEHTPEGPRLTHTVGAMPSSINAQALFGQRNPLRASLQSGSPIFISDVNENDDWRDSPLVRQMRARGIVCLPILIAERPVASMLAATAEPLPPLSEEELRLYQQIARQASVVLQNLSLLSTTRGRLQEVNILLDFSRQLTGLDSGQIIHALLESSRQAVAAGQAGVALLWEEPAQLLVPRAVAGYADDAAMMTVTYRRGEAIPGRVHASGTAERLDEVEFSRDLRLRAESLGLYRQATGGRLPLSSLAVPLLVEDRSIGVLVLDNFDSPAAFSLEDEALVLSLCQQAALSLENMRLFAETEKLAQEMEQRVIERTAELRRAQHHTETLLRKEQEEATRSKAILESVADGVVVTGPDNRIAFLNPSVHRILATDPRRLLGEPIESLGSLFGEAGHTWLKTIRQWAAHPAAYRPGETYAEKMDLGADRIALVHLAPVILDTDFLGTVSILRDITHEVEVERLKSEFVATVSHELRTPMTSIRGYLEMLLMGAGGTLTENQSHFLDIISRNVDRLHTLVDALLDVSSIEAGKISLSQEALDLAQIAADAIAEFQRRAEADQKTISFSLHAPRTLPRVLGDSERIRQIVMSVLDNAYHYTPANGSVEIRIHSSTSRREVQLDVTDNGIGIPARDQPRIFERFFRGEDSLVLATPGTGLGLSIAKQLAEMHHGRIWFKSEGIPGRGATFSIALPAHVANPKAAAANADQR